MDVCNGQAGALVRRSGLCEGKLHDDEQPLHLLGEMFHIGARDGKPRNNHKSHTRTQRTRDAEFYCTVVHKANPSYTYIPMCCVWCKVFVIAAAANITPVGKGIG
jgi:hypothetical protein